MTGPVGFDKVRSKPPFYIGGDPLSFKWWGGGGCFRLLLNYQEFQVPAVINPQCACMRGSHSLSQSVSHYLNFEDGEMNLAKT